MSNSMSRPYTKPMKLFAGTAVAALLIGWAAGVGAQTTDAIAPAAAGFTAGERHDGKSAVASARP